MIPTVQMKMIHTIVFNFYVSGRESSDRNIDHWIVENSLIYPTLSLGSVFFTDIDKPVPWKRSPNGPHTNASEQWSLNTVSTTIFTFHYQFWKKWFIS